MNNALQFDFLVDKHQNTLTIKREFEGDKQLVWDCYTKSELLDQWFAPDPFTTKTKSMDFREGGHWHYAMVDPEGKEYWGWTTYLKIKAVDFYDTEDVFSDAEGNINKDLPIGNWHVVFKEKADNTLVETIVYYPSLDALEQVLQMGMKEGMISTLNRLDQLLEELKK